MGPAADLDAGALLGDRYRLDAVLGQGGMATVYRAHDVVLGRDVAVKVFPPVAEGADEVLRHQAEMRVLARLNHPHLVTLHDAGTSALGGPLQQTYLVMELVPGPTLADRLLQGPLTAAGTARLGRQVADALVVVHAAGVVHRDLKPANVLLTHPDDGRAAGPTVKLADFGIARLSDGTRLTVTGTTLGTASYLSPEQATGSALGPPSDLYSLGLVLLECLTGARAFTGTMLEVAAARLTTSPPVPDDLGTPWTGLLRAMTSREPGDRPDAAEVAARLAELEVTAPLAATRTMPPVVGTGPADPGPQPAAAPDERSAPPSGSRGRAGHLPRLAVVGLVLLVGGGAALAAQARQDDAPQPPPYPAVEGGLGEALSDLQRSVQP